MTACPECGAALLPERACRDYFHDLLALEAQVPGAPGAEPHFLAVAAYNLQHPSAFVPAALVGLLQTVADVLAGRVTVADARRRARRATDGPGPVRRRADTPLSEADSRLLGAWPTRWAMTVRDVSEVTPEQYVAQVQAWARCVTVGLERAPAPPGSGRINHHDDT